MSAVLLREGEAPAEPDSRASLRWGIYWLLIVASAASMTARIAQVRSTSVKDPSPFLSANDRSRWCTIRSLVDEGTYAIDRVIFKPDGTRDRRWHTIDLVRHGSSDGAEHYYSSKPTLLPTLLAGEYYFIREATGATLQEKPFYIARIMLFVTNVLPLVLALALLARIVEEFGTTDWGRVFTMAAAAFGTYLTTFAITLNNHLPAAIGVTLTIAAAWPIWMRGIRCPRRYLLAGFLAAFTAANELPALSFFAVVAAGLWLRSPRQTLLFFLPAASVVALAAVGTNYLAHGSLRPAYAHRSEGPVVATVANAAAPDVAARLDRGDVPAELYNLNVPGMDLMGDVVVEPYTPGKKWLVGNIPKNQRWKVTLVARSTGPPELEVRQSDNWYDYPGTYWTEANLRGVDRGEPSRLVYAFHMLIGHHGLLSLTPIWLITIWGAVIALRSRERPRQAFAAAVILLTVVVLAFYLSRPLIDRNYGGMTTGLRWMFWFTPLWLLLMLPALDRLANSRLAQALAAALLVISVFSTHYGSMNPWTHPWIFDYWEQLGWIRYP